MATRVVMPKLGLTMEEGTILRWMHAAGDHVHSGQPLLEVEGDKTATEVESPAEGILLQILVDEGETVAVGAAVGVIGAVGETLEEQQQVQSTADTEPVRRSPPAAEASSHRRTDRPAGRVLISPRARRLAERAGIDWTTITGSDAESGRIQERDVRAALAARSATGVATSFSSLRATLARKLRTSINEAPHIHLWIDVDAAELIDSRNTYNSRHPGDRVTFGAMFVMAAARALVEHPQLNAAVEGQSIIRYSSVNIAVAVGLEEGVVAPVIQDAASRSLAEIQSQSRHLVTAARTASLLPDDLSGGTFTVSNLGATAVRAFTAILNPPQVGILSIGAMEERPAVHDGVLSVRPMVTIGLGADHRAVDGIHAAAFLATLKQLLEEPQWMRDRDRAR